jgi:hypothetical protein
MIDDIVDARRLARHADQILLAVALDIARADIGVVAPERLDNIVESKPIGREPVGNGDHVIWRS